MKTAIEMLTKRQQEILLYLYTNKNHQSPMEIFTHNFEVGKRTIQKDIYEISIYVKSFGIDIQTEKNNSVQLRITNQDAACDFIDELVNEYNNCYFFNDSTSRVKYIIMELLNSNDYVKSESLAEKMFISRAQISKDIKNVKEKLKPYGLKIISKPYHGMKIEGTELNIRKYITNENLNAEKINDFHFGLSNTISNSLLNVNDIVSNILSESNYIISETTLQNLLVHIVVSINRMKQGQHIIENDSNLGPVYNHVCDIAEKIISECSKRYDFTYNKSEVQLLAINLFGKREHDNQEFITNEINDLIFQGLLQIKNKYGYDFTSNINLRISLGLHLLPLLARVKNNMQLKNYMSLNIKQKYTLSFEFATLFLNSVLQNSIKLTDDEIAYTALHFLNYIEDTSSAYNKKNLLIISSLRRSENILLKSRILRNYPNIQNIDIINTNSLNSVCLEKYNLVCSTESNIIINKQKVPKISLDLSNADKEKIELLLDGFNSSKDFLDCFDKELFYTGKAKNKEEIINILYNNAKNKGLANDELLDSVMLHEEITYSYFGNGLAIPHPESPQTSTSFISVAILSEPIFWDDTYVDLVFLVSIQKDNYNAIRLWFYLSFLISNVDALNEIRKGKTFEEFQAVLSKIYGELFS